MEAVYRVDEKTDNGASAATKAEDAAKAEGTTSDFDVTHQVEALNDKLKDGIFGVLKRAGSVLNFLFRGLGKLLFVWIPKLLNKVFVALYRVMASICKKIWAVISFMFSARFLRFMKQNFLLILLGIILIVLIIWPFLVPVVFDISDAGIWNIFGAIWFLTIGVVGAIRGIRNGSWKRLAGNIKNKLKERKARRLAKKEAKRLAKEEARQAKQRAKEEAKHAQQPGK